MGRNKYTPQQRKNFWANRRAAQKDTSIVSPLTQIFANISTGMKEKLTEISLKRQEEISLLVAKALYNELVSDEPFACYNLTLPEIDYDPFYSQGRPSEKNSALLFSYIAKYPGMNLDRLMLAHRDIGIRSMDELKEALKVLLILEQIDEYSPLRRVSRFSTDEYKVYRIKQERFKRPTKQEVNDFIGSGPLNDVEEEK